MAGQKKRGPIRKKNKNSVRKIGRPRNIESHNAILAASLKLLLEKGYRLVTIEAIAAEAAVGKQTIYRWWRSKAEVVLEAFARQTADRVAVPDRGSVQDDLYVFLKQAFEILTEDSGEIVRGLMSEALVDPDFAEAMRDIFIARRRGALRDIIVKGIDRGELAPDMDIELVIDLIYGPMWYRLLNKHAPLDSSFAKNLTEIVVGRLIWNQKKCE